MIKWQVYKRIPFCRYSKATVGGILVSKIETIKHPTGHNIQYAIGLFDDAFIKFNSENTLLKFITI